MEESTRALLEKSIDLLKAGKQKEAVPLLAGLLKQNPNLEMGWYLLGMSLESTEQRIRAFNEVLRINPNNQKARQQLDLLHGPAVPQETLPHVNPFIDEPAMKKTTPPQQSTLPSTPVESSPPMPVKSPTPSRPLSAAPRPSFSMSTPVPASGWRDRLERVWKKLRDMQPQLLGGLVLLIGIALTVLLVSSLSKDVPLWIFGRTVDGTILTKSWSDFDYHNPGMENKNLANQISLNMEYYFEYEFTTPDGETYIGQSEVTEEEFLGYVEGMQLKVRYSTLNPENSRLDDARLVPFLMCTYSIFMIITLFALAAGRELVDF